MISVGDRGGAEAAPRRRPGSALVLAIREEAMPSAELMRRCLDASRGLGEGVVVLLASGAWSVFLPPGELK